MTQLNELVKEWHTMPLFDESGNLLDQRTISFCADALEAAIEQDVKLLVEALREIADSWNKRNFNSCELARVTLSRFESQGKENL